MEQDDSFENPEYQNWLNILIAPGSSLGGARPKSNVIDNQGRLWIAKFPSRNDHYNIGGWEYVVNQLAKKSGLNVPEAKIEKLNNPYYTYFSKRFDRTDELKRVHFASAMTLLNYTDGVENASYLELAETIITHSSEADQDLKELWGRIVFNICVSNTDDHLRNHGFIYHHEKGWRLSPAYDVNPVSDKTGLHLNINLDENNQDLDLVLSVAEDFRVGNVEAIHIIERIVSNVNIWRNIATDIGISKREQQEMSEAFRIAAATTRTAW